MGIINTAKTNVRRLIDCKGNFNGTRSDLFTHYEGLAKRYIILNNVKEDLTIKKNILEKENVRCGNRCKFLVLTTFLIHYNEKQNR